MNRLAHFFRASLYAVPNGLARSLVLASLLAIAISCCSGQDEVHITPHVTQSAASGAGQAKNNDTQSVQFQRL